ncbi:N(6)-L-threonylcarbamoyladenine synthase Kae1 [Candidatus Bathyarchaeota archaeon]|nr:N(6)-L-threonylcarbamoyladenine synthase Kae1 [Candidatus Bathyarchaeota archaeon]
MQKREGYCLGIESTADDFGVGIVSFSGEILANVNNVYVPETGGIHPREASRHHAMVAGSVIAEAFRRAGIKPKEINVIAFSQGPGLGPCLRVGATAARALASYLNKPLVGVNHCLAHIEIGKMISEARDPVTLYVSGGNTIVAAFEARRYRVFGETLDIAVGNCLDVFAREAGLKPRADKPFGAIVEELASKGGRFIPLPYTVKGMDLSFSGLLTAAVNLLREGKYSLEDLCFSFQEIAFSMLTEVTERALAHTEKGEVLLTGGVAANKRLQAMLKTMSEEHDACFRVVPKEYATDNGAMIAWTGVLCYQYGFTIPVEESFVRLKWRLDDVEVPWVKID